MPTRSGGVLLCRDYIQDNRTSMEVYADNLVKNLTGLIEFDQYRPLPLLKSNDMLGIIGRAERYIRYPFILPGEQDLYHVLDHGYAHLRNFQGSSSWVLTCHDIIPYLSNRGLAKGLPRVRRPLFSEYSMKSYKNYDRIISISQSTKNDLIKYAKVKPEKIDVVYYGISDKFRKFDDEIRLQCKKKYGFSDRWNILICGFQHYKNHETCIEVINELSKKYQKDIALIRVGPLTKEWGVLKSRMSNRILLKEHFNLSEDEMVELYNGSDCVLFPSWYEGFGWPPVEAMKCGTPAIVSNVASLPEAVGEGGLKYSPEDVFGMMEGVSRLMLSPGYLKDVSDYGISHAENFNWKRNAFETMRVYKDLL